MKFMRLDYKQLKEDFKRVLSQVNKEEIKKWLEEDENRIEKTSRRNGKTERLLQVALDKLMSEKVISIGKEVCEYGATRTYATFVDRDPKNFINRLIKTGQQLKLPLKWDDDYNIYLLDKSEDFNNYLIQSGIFKGGGVLEFFEYSETKDYLNKYISFVNTEKTPITYVEEGVHIKATNLEYIKIIS